MKLYEIDWLFIKLNDIECEALWIQSHWSHRLPSNHTLVRNATAFASPRGMQVMQMCCVARHAERADAAYALYRLPSDAVLE